MKKGRHVIFCGFAISLLAASSAWGGAISDREYALKAAYIYNFTKFIEWPRSNEPVRSTFSIGILGDDPFGPSIDATVAGKTVEGRRIIIERFPDIDAMRRSARALDIIFIGVLSPDSLAAALEYTRNLPILTIGESSGFCEKGGVINFVIRKNHIRLEINRAAAELAELKISSKLMQLASRPGEDE